MGHTNQRRGRTIRTAALAAVAAVGVIAAGCATRRPPSATPSAPSGPASSATNFTATAYCHGTTTATGVKARPGIVAADPAVLPFGSVVRIERTSGYDGTYTVMDTGSKLQGRRIDLFLESCAAAKRFGRRTVRVRVVETRKIKTETDNQN